MRRGGRAYDVGELSFGDEVLRFRADELLLQCDQLRALRLFVLELLDLVGDLGFVVPAWLHRAFGVSDLLQDAPVVLQILSEDIFLLSQLLLITISAPRAPAEVSVHKAYR